eukprot:scaffold1795_cov92-Skeletonema_dohrnii-CCMP3373.AAC.1
MSARLISPSMSVEKKRLRPRHSETTSGRPVDVEIGHKDEERGLIERGIVGSRKMRSMMTKMPP